MNLDFAKSDGLIAAVIQDHATGRVLMVGYMNEEAFRKTVESGFATFYSRSRRKLWLKGETSGHRLVVKEISTDCDRDAVLVKVEALGPGVCHEGYQSCFFRRLENDEWKVSEERTYDPNAVYHRTAAKFLNSAISVPSVLSKLRERRETIRARANHFLNSTLCLCFSLVKSAERQS